MGATDVERLASDVRYVDNEQNLDATELPVPEASSPTTGSP